MSVEPPGRSGVRRRTLRGRVSLLAILTIAGWLVVLTAVFNLIFIKRLDGQAYDALRIRAQAASATVVVSAAGRVTARESRTDSELDSSIWIYSGRSAIERPPGDALVQRTADSLVDVGTAHRDAGEATRFYALPIRTAEGRQVGTIVAGLNMGPYHGAEHAALIGSAVISILILAGAYPILRVAAGRALRPVERMARQAADWSMHDPSQRLGAEQQFEELHRLAGSLDALLDRLSAVLRYERQLSAELSHELRTPLAYMAAEIDIMLADPHLETEHAAANRRIRDRIESMDRIIDTLLSAARLDHSSQPAGACAVDDVMESVLAHSNANGMLRYEPTGLFAGVDAEVLERIVAPIVDNAGRYATARIAITATPTSTGLAVDISNDGAPLDTALAEMVFEPGFRADASDPHRGAGLGLALSRRLARAADGDVAVLATHAARDRTTFRVSLPPA